MSCEFALIRLHPSATEEHINIGIIAFGENETLCYFVKNEERIQSFYHGMTGETINEFLSTRGWENNPPSLDYFNNLKRISQNIIQFSGMKVSMVSVKETIEAMVPVFLHEPFCKKVLILPTNL